MWKRFLISIFVISVLILSLSACDDPLPTATPLPSCDPASFVAPVPVSPSPYQVIGLNPSLTWNYPDSCEPEGYAIHLSNELDFSDPSLYGATGNPSTSWAPGVPLEPGRQYWWKVAPGTGVELGPWSILMRFITGPVCTDAEIVAPTLLSPEDGTTVTDNLPSLRYNPTSPCTPEKYFIDLQTDPAFSGVTLIGDTTSTGISVDILARSPGASGQYKALINKYEVTCQTYEEYLNSLFCDSPKPPTNSLAELVVWDTDDNEICVRTFSVPAPEEATKEPKACTPPQKGCGDSKLGYYWDEKKCECRQCPQGQIYDEQKEVCQ